MNKITFEPKSTDLAPFRKGEFKTEWCAINLKNPRSHIITVRQYQTASNWNTVIWIYGQFPVFGKTHISVEAGGKDMYVEYSFDKAFKAIGIQGLEFGKTQEAIIMQFCEFLGFDRSIIHVHKANW